jgi:hypothetical protein
VHVVADWDMRDPAVDDVLRRLAVAVPNAAFVVDHVAPGDTLAAGLRVARLVFAGAAAGGLVIHDVALDDDASAWPVGDPEPFCAGHSRGGTLVVGAAGGWSWSFVISALSQLCRVDVPAGGRRGTPRAGLPAAVAHVWARHPHATEHAVPRASVPAPPARFAMHGGAGGRA